ncbi:MAG: hypothetical protein Q4A07_00470 [Coriobacteriales bacterium]|nr:hypothetical protein [Coriobacteriales bacterium]
MSIIKKATPFDNQVICGERLVPADEDSAHAIYVRHGRVCGVTYEKGVSQPYLRFSPGYQLPPWARDKKPFKRFVWECEDERAVNIRLDTHDGELAYICRDDNIDKNIEDLVEDNLELLLGDTLYDALVEYVRSLKN